jgi:bifunctional non-homologous end joining protein LigD
MDFVVALQRRKPAAIGVKAPFPGFVKPAVATSVEKLDGYRVQVRPLDRRP